MLRLRQLSLDQRLEVTADLIVRSRIFFDIWFYLADADTRRTTIDTMRQFSEFFRFAPEAHFIGCVVQIFAVFDKRGGAASLVNPANEMKAAKMIAPKVASEVEALLTHAKPLADKVAILRHSVFAHRSASTSRANAFKKAKLTPNQLRYLHEIALKIASRLSYARGLKEKVFNPLPREHLKAMLITLARHANDCGRET